VVSDSVIGVVGAGVMGQGLAHTLAQHGHEVVLVDLTSALLEHARAEIEKSIKLQLLCDRKNAPQDVAGLFARVLFTVDYDRLQTATFVIENVIEKVAVKDEVYPRLDRICPPDCVLAANTSAVSITHLAGLTRRPEQVLGMHFMNPVPMKHTVEVIRGLYTSEATLARASALLSSIGKQGIVVADSPGFVSNRVLMLTVNEAMFLVHEQVAAAEDVDRIFKSCFGHKMGPLETADLIGLDTVLYSLEVLYQSFNDPKFRPCPLLRKMVDAKLYGRKSGRGFYDYSI
jgi:3-hydroxybutyryl-CoA dehydrogenase